VRGASGTARLSTSRQRRAGGLGRAVRRRAGRRLARRDPAGGEQRDLYDQCEDGGQRQRLARSGDAGAGVLGRISHRRAVGGPDMTAWLASRCMLLVYVAGSTIAPVSSIATASAAARAAQDARWWWPHSRRSAGCGRAGVGEMRTLTTGLAGQQQARSARGGGPGQAPRYRQAVACGEETQSRRASVRQPPYQGLGTWPRRDVRPGSIVRLPGHAGLLADLGAGRPAERLPSAQSQWLSRLDRLAPARFLAAAPGGPWWLLPPGGPFQHVSSFSVCISCSGPRTAHGPALGPVPGSGADRTCRPAGAASGRERA
jgi:hypothetical protein